MGNLKVATSKNNCPKFTGFRTPEEVGNLVYYITRTKEKNNRKDLLECGYVGLPGGISVDDIISVILKTQYFYRGSGDIGPRVYHEIYWLSPEETFYIRNCAKWRYCISRLARETAEVYFRQGFQVVYAVHENGSGDSYKLHIHYAVNTVNFVTGKKFHTNFYEDQRRRENDMNQVLNEIITWSVRCGNC